MRQKENLNIQYDMQKCFDTKWASEALNGAYELGFNNDKVPLVQMPDMDAIIAIKSTAGISEEEKTK